MACNMQLETAGGYYRCRCRSWYERYYK